MFLDVPAPLCMRMRVDFYAPIAPAHAVNKLAYKAHLVNIYIYM